METPEDEDRRDDKDDRRDAPRQRRQVAAEARQEIEAADARRRPRFEHQRLRRDLTGSKAKRALLVKHARKIMGLFAMRVEADRQGPVADMKLGEKVVCRGTLAALAGIFNLRFGTDVIKTFAWLEERGWLVSERTGRDARRSGVYVLGEIGLAVSVGRDGQRWYRPRLRWRHGRWLDSDLAGGVRKNPNSKGREKPNSIRKNPNSSGAEQNLETAEVTDE